MADRSVNVRLRLNIADFERNAAKVAATTAGMARELETADSRLGNIVQTALAIAPAFVPIASTAVPAIAGLSAQLGFAVTAAGVSVLAFAGIGDGLKALNQYQLEPTQANLEKLNEAMATLGPAGQDFVRTLQSIRPEMQGLQDIAQAGMFPGMTDGIDELMQLMPEAEKMIDTVSTTLGNLAREAGDNLNDKRWRDFFAFLDSEAGPTLEAMGKSFGNVIEGLTNLMMAGDPLSDMFTDGLLDATRDFKDWSDNLDSSQGFQKFISYIQDNGPEAMETLGAIGTAFVDLITAAAPVGSALLPVLKVMAETFSAIAESPIGPPLILAASGLAAVSRSVALFRAANGSAIVGMFSGIKKESAGVDAAIKQSGSGLAVMNERISKIKTGMKVGAASAGILALSLTDVDDKAGLANTTMLAMAGSMGGPWGAAAGAAIGFTLDLASANDRLESAMDRVRNAFSRNDVDEQKAALKGLQTEIDAAKEGYSQFAEMAVSGNPMDFDILQAGKTGFLQLIGAIDSAEETYARFKAQAASGKDLAGLLGGPLGMVADDFLSADAAMEKFTASFKALNNLLSDKQSLIDYERALDDLRKSIKAPGNKGNNFDIGTERGRGQVEQLIGLMDAAITRSDTLKQHGRDLASQKILTRAISDLENFRDKFPGLKGVTQEMLDELQRLADKHVKPKIEGDNKPLKGEITEADFWLTGLDNKHTEPKIDGNANGLMGVIALARAAIASIHDKTITITSVYTTLGRPPGNLPPAPSAYGNLFFDRGDVMNGHQPVLARGGPTRMWNEPETGGEAYIPLRNDGRRPRAKSILEQTAAMMNGEVHWFSGGGTAGAIGVGVRGGGGHGIKDADDQAKSFAKRLKEAQRELEKETEQRRNLIDDMKSFKQEVAGSFSNDPFGNGLAGFDLQVEADKNDAEAMERALRRAKRKGLDGGLFAALAASGDLNTAQQFAGLSRRQIRQREQLFGSASRARGDLGQMAATERFGDELRESNRERKHLIKTVHALQQQVKHIGKDVEVGARRGVGDQDRRTSQRSKVGR